MRTRLLPSLLALGVIAAAPTMAAGAPAADTYWAQLQPVNAVGASGSATLSQTGTNVSIQLSASGLSSGMHLMHIHGVRGGNATCPTIALDLNGDGRVDLAEGLPAYGPVVVTLSMNDMGTNVSWSRLFKHRDNGDAIASLGSLDNYVVVVHGVDLNGDGVANNPDVNGDGPGMADNEISMPALCGVISG